MGENKCCGFCISSVFHKTDKQRTDNLSKPILKLISDFQRLIEGQFKSKRRKSLTLSSYSLLFELAAHALNTDVKVAFPTGGVGASPHTLLFPLHNDLSPLHLLKETG